MNNQNDQRESDEDTDDKPPPKPKTPNFSSVKLQSTNRDFPSVTLFPEGVKMAQSEWDHLKAYAQSSNVEPSEPRFSVSSGKEIPSFHLERPVRVDKPVEEVAAAIDKDTRKRSVETNFNTTEARAICLTSDFLKYYVNLYSDVDGTTLVEVQRRKGCCIHFRQERQAIINAVQCTVPKAPRQQMLMIPPELLDEVGRPTAKEMKDIIENCASQLHKKRADGHIMALQHLACMTDPKKSSTHSANMATEILLNSDVNLRHLIVANITGRHGPDDVSVMTRNACLKVFANCYGNLAKSNENDIEKICQKDIWFQDTFLPIIISCIHKEDCLHNVSLAMRNLHLLLDNSSSCLAKAKESPELNIFLVNALSKGQKHHQTLENETQKAIRSLGH